MRKQAIKMKISDGKIEIDYHKLSIPKSSAKARMYHLKRLIEAVLLADSDLACLTGIEAALQRPAIEAQNLVYQFRIYEATEAALLLRKVILGEASIGENGFPEIGPGYIQDV